MIQITVFSENDCVKYMDSGVANIIYEPIGEFVGEQYKIYKHILFSFHNSKSFELLVGSKNIRIYIKEKGFRNMVVKVDEIKSEEDLEKLYDDITSKIEDFLKSEH